MTFQECNMRSVNFMTFQVYHDPFKPWNKSITTDKPWKSQRWCWVCISFYTQRTSLSLHRLHFCFHHLQILWYVSSTTMKWSMVLNLTFTRLSNSPLLFFFLVSDAILKHFSYLFGAKFNCAIQWCHDNWPIGVSNIWRHFWHSICQSLFSSMNIIYDMIQIHSGETSRAINKSMHDFKASF